MWTSLLSSLFSTSTLTSAAWNTLGVPAQVGVGALGACAVYGAGSAAGAAALGVINYGAKGATVNIDGRDAVVTRVGIGWLECRTDDGTNVTLRGAEYESAMEGGLTRNSEAGDIAREAIAKDNEGSVAARTLPRVASDDLEAINLRDDLTSSRETLKSERADALGAHNLALQAARDTRTTLASLREDRNTLQDDLKAAYSGLEMQGARLETALAALERAGVTSQDEEVTLVEETEIVESDGGFEAIAAMVAASTSPEEAMAEVEAALIEAAAVAHVVDPAEAMDALKATEAETAKTEIVEAKKAPKSKTAKTAKKTKTEGKPSEEAATA